MLKFNILIKYSIFVLYIKVSLKKIVNLYGIEIVPPMNF